MKPEGTELPRDVLVPKPEEVAELGRIRRRELEGLSERLGRVDTRPKSQVWTGVAGALASAALGALLAGIPLLSSDEARDSWVLPAYIAAIVGVLILAGVCVLAATAMRRERADSVSDVKTDLDRLLAAYERRGTELEQTDPVEIERIERELVRDSLIAIRTEARENLKLIERAAQERQYWRLSEGGPKVAVWRQQSALLQGERDLEDLVERGQHLANEVERITTRRAMRIFAMNRRVDDDARLDEVAQGLRDFEQDLTGTLDALA